MGRSGVAARHSERYASQDQYDVVLAGALPLGVWDDARELVRLGEDRSERTSGVRVVTPVALPGS